MREDTDQASQTMVLLRWLRLHHHWWRLRPLGRCRGRHQRCGQRQACGLLRVLGLVPGSVQQSTCPNSRLSGIQELFQCHLSHWFLSMSVECIFLAVPRLSVLWIYGFSSFQWDHFRRLDPCKLSLTNGRPIPAANGITILTFYEAATILQRSSSSTWREQGQHAETLLKLRFVAG